MLRAPVISTPIADLIPRAFAISAALAVTIYDSLNVALAEKRDIAMVTADERLIRRLLGVFGEMYGLGGRSHWLSRHSFPH